MAQRGCSSVVGGSACTLRTRNQRGSNRRSRFASSAGELPGSLALGRLSTTRARSASVCNLPTAQNGGQRGQLSGGAGELRSPPSCRR